MFDDCGTGVEVKSLAGRLLAAEVPLVNARLVAATVREHVQVQATKKLDHKTVAACRDRYLNGTEPARGRQPALSVGFDELIKKWVILQRLHFKVPVTRPRLLHHVKVVLRDSGAVNSKGTPYEDAIDLAWVDRFLRRTSTDLTYTYNRPLDANRARWCTPENIAAHIVILAETLCANGVADFNPDYDHTDPESRQLFITYPQLLMSFDETGFEMDQGEDRTKGVHVKEYVSSPPLVVQRAYPVPPAFMLLPHFETDPDLLMPHP